MYLYYNTYPLAHAHYLVELEHVEKIKELPVLLLVKKLDVVLLKAVEGELGLIINVDLERLQE